MEHSLPSLTGVEVRVLGCLVEKELCTPEYYPLSLNALTNACNQKTNRDPVLDLEETDVVRGLDRLRQLGLAAQDAEGGRVPKYMHNLQGKLRLEEPEVALIAELFLRGHQTAGELRARAERMHPFPDLVAVERVLEALLTREEPLAAKLPRQPGRKEHRYAHLLSGEPELAREVVEAPPETATLRVRGEDERIGRLEREVASLKEELGMLSRAFGELKAQFD